MTGATTLTLSDTQRISSTYNLGDAISGSLNQVGDQATYQFTLSDPTSVWFNITGGAYQASLVRTDQQATVFASGSNATSLNWPGLYSLAAGTYELRIVPTTVAPGTYKIDSSTAAALPPLTFGTTQIVSVPQDQMATVWGISGIAGQQLLISPTHVSGSYFPSWTLYGPSGQTVASGVAWGWGDNSLKVTLPQDGVYVLELYGAPGDLSPRTSTMTVNQCEQTIIPVNLGDQVTASLAGPGDINHYQFTLAEDTTVLVDPLGGTANMTLSGPTGTLLNFSSGSTGSYYTERLAAGTYSLDVSGSGISTPSFGF